MNDDTVVMSKRQREAALQVKVGMNYREVTGALIQVRNEVRTRKPQPEVVVVIDGLTDLQKDTIAELLRNPNLEFKITAVDSSDGKDIQLHIRNANKVF
jgi:hypothetical protein